MLPSLQLYYNSIKPLQARKALSGKPYLVYSRYLHTLPRQTER